MGTILHVSFLKPSIVLTLNNCLLNKQNQFNKVFLEQNSTTEENHMQIGVFYEGYKEIALFVTLYSLILTI